MKTNKILLISVFGFVLVAATGTYFFTAKKQQSQSASFIEAPGMETDGAVLPASELPDPGSSEVVDVQSLLISNACLGCHAVDTKVVGPAFRDVAAKYRDDPKAPGKVAANIRRGGAEQWGEAMMPPMPNLTEVQAQQLAEFVLQQ